MKTNMKKAIVPALFAMAFAAGCGTPPEPPPPTVNEILASKNITLDFPAAGKGGPAKGVAPGDEASQFVKVASPFKVYELEGGHRRAQMRIRNITAEAFGVAYVVSWFDTDGAELFARPRKTALLQPMSTVALTDFCTDPTGVAAEIELHLVPADQVVENTLTFEDAARELVSKFASDTQFLAALKKVQAALGKDKKPIMVVRSFEIDGPRGALRLDTLAQDFRNEVRKTGFFDLKDDEATQAMIDRIKFSADSGLESGELLEAFRSHVSPDFILTGVLRSGKNGRGILFLTLHDLSGTSGRGGTIAWEDKTPIGE